MESGEPSHRKKQHKIKQTKAIGCLKARDQNAANGSFCLAPVRCRPCGTNRNVDVCHVMS